jgi:hypothetical protein
MWLIMLALGTASFVLLWGVLEVIDRFGGGAG